MNCIEKGESHWALGEFLNVHKVDNVAIPLELHGVTDKWSALIS